MPASTAAAVAGRRAAQVHYSEGVLVGYRWYSTRHITPMFPFGYGLSYTTFAFSHLAVAPWPPAATVTVSASVTNTGRGRAPTWPRSTWATRPSTGEPAEQLKGFQRVQLRPGQTRRVSFALDRSAFAWWNPQTSGWAVTPGDYGVMVGDSSASLPLTAHVAVP